MLSIDFIYKKYILVITKIRLLKQRLDYIRWLKLRLD